MALLRRARERNEAAQLTGVLLCKDGKFMQALEGEEENVERVFRRICADDRIRASLYCWQDPWKSDLAQIGQWGFGTFGRWNPPNVPASMTS